MVTYKLYCKNPGIKDKVVPVLNEVSHHEEVSCA